MDTAHILSDITDNVTALGQQVSNLVKSLVELTALYNTLPIPVPGLVIGAGRYKSNPDLLTDAQMKDITDNVARGNLVQLCLYKDRGQVGSVIARVIWVSGEWFGCVRWGEDENDKTKTFQVKSPRKDVWGWYVCSKLIGA